jgi:hypothetical protein
MKKLTAILVVIVMLAAMVPSMVATAVKDFDNLGTVPKTLTTPVMDGERDAIYDQGLKVPVRTEKDDNPVLGGGGDMWLLWDDNYLYVYATFNLKDGNNLKTPHEDYMNSCWWEDTMIEFCVDFENEGESNIKYMPGAHGDITAVRGWPAEEPEDVPKIIDGVSKVTGNTWNAEFRISFAGSKALLAEKSDSGDGFGSPIAAGKAIGFGGWYQEATPDESSSFYVCLPARVEDFGVNNPPSYDYIVLGANEVKDEPAPAEQAPAEGNNTPEAAPAPAPGPEPAAPAPAAPVTGDATAIILLAFVLSFAALVIRAKRVKN